MRLILAVLSTILFAQPSSGQENEYSLYCEATRVDDGSRVKYQFRFVGKIARAKYGNWRVEETPDELVLTYLERDGTERSDTFIRINRFTGELYHSAVGGSSVYLTKTGDKPCARLERRF